MVSESTGSMSGVRPLKGSVWRPAAVISAAILMTLSAGWIGCGYRYVHILRFSNCCGPGIMLGPGPFEVGGYVMLGGSVLTIVMAALMVRGVVWAAWGCVVIAVLAVWIGASRVRTAWPGPDSVWHGRHLPWWFTALMQGWPDVIAGLLVTTLLATSLALRLGRRPQTLAG